MVEFFTMPENFPVARKTPTHIFRSIESLVRIIQVWVAKFIIGPCNSVYSTKEKEKLIFLLPGFIRTEVANWNGLPSCAADTFPIVPGSGIIYR
jgi:hypothetical protein